MYGRDEESRVCLGFGSLELEGLIGGDAGGADTIRLEPPTLLKRRDEKAADDSVVTKTSCCGGSIHLLLLSQIRREWGDGQVRGLLLVQMLTVYQVNMV